VSGLGRGVEPRYIQRRGTRGFAAFTTGLAGFVVLGFGLVVLPSSRLDQLALAWLIPLVVAFGLLHLVAVYGLLRRRIWSGSLVGYLAAVGIGVAAYGLLLALTGQDPFGATGAADPGRTWAQGIGLLVWMTGLWLVAARFAFKGVAPMMTSARAPQSSSAAA
jgi:hypothetical protein